MLIGDPAAWLARFQDVEQRLINRLPEVWPASIVGLTDHPHEDQITRRFVVHLQKDPETRKLGAIHAQLTNSTGRATSRRRRYKGYVDIAIVLGENPDCYVAFECKRLNVVNKGKLSTLAGAYVKEGMLRYVYAEYAQDLPLGGMIGYVLNGDTLAAEKRVCAAISTWSASLCSSGGPVVSAPIGFIRRLMTGHDRAGETSSFEIRHTLLPYHPR